MSNFKYTNGIIIRKEISTSSIEAGTISLFQKDNTLHRVTIQHMDPLGYWFVDGDYTGKISKERKLFRLEVLTNEGSYPVAVSDWKSIINADLIGKDVNIKLLSHKFVEGNYTNECCNCTAYFEAAKKQPYCKSCCEVLATAILKTETKIINNKRPRLLKASLVKDIGLEAYDMLANRLIPKYEFEDWLDNKINNVYNNNT